MAISSSLSTAKIAAIGAGAVLLVVAGASTAYALHYGDRALPNTTLAGHNVSGMTHDEVVALIADLEQSLAITATVGTDTTVLPLTDLGVTIDEAATADAVLAKSESIIGRFSALVSPVSIPVVAAQDEAVVDAYVQRLAAEQGPAPKSATVSATPEGAFVVTPGEQGSVVDPAALKDAIGEALSTLSAQNAQLDVQIVDPTVTTQEAQAVADQAEKLIAPEVELTDGIDTFTASTAEKAAWVVLPDEADSGAVVSFDDEKIAEWVNATAEKTNVAPTPIINNVDAAGTVLVEGARPGKSGLSVNNASQVAADLTGALNAGTDFSSSFDYDTVEPEVETRQVMAGYENYVYPMTEGEKWIDVDLTGNRVTLYEGQTVIGGPYAVNHGSPGHETVTGLYHIYLQYEKQDMGCTEGWSYCAKDVPWVSYFTGSYALHGAPWVSTFGRGSVNGSHGCVNLPVDAAYTLYTWAPIGTPVKSHY